MGVFGWMVDRVRRNPQDIHIIDNHSVPWERASEDLLLFLGGKGLDSGRDYILIDGSGRVGDTLPASEDGNVFPILEIMAGNAYGLPYSVISGERRICDFFELYKEVLGI